MYVYFSFSLTIIFTIESFIHSYLLLYQLHILVYIYHYQQQNADVCIYTLLHNLIYITAVLLTVIPQVWSDIAKKTYRRYTNPISSKYIVCTCTCSITSIVTSYRIEREESSPFLLRRISQSIAVITFIASIHTYLFTISHFILT